MSSRERVKYYVFIAVCIGFYVLTQMFNAGADPYGANNVTVQTSTRYNFTINPKIVYAEAGNMTELEINATSISTSYGGFYGNVSGSVLLSDAQGNTLYDWNLSSASGEVYASRSGAITWSSVNCTNETLIGEEQAYLGQNFTDPDSLNNTYTGTAHPAFLVGINNVTSCPSTELYYGGGPGTGFWQVLLADQSNSTIYTTLLNTVPHVGFDNRSWDFELLVGVNGKGSNASTAIPYYVYVELA